MDLSQFDMEKILHIEQEFLIETSNLKTVVECCTEAKQYSRMIGIIGEPGYGKTKSLDYYRSNHDDTFYLVVEKSMKSKQVYIDLLQQTGLNSMDFREAGLNGLIRALAYHLNKSKTKNLSKTSQIQKRQNLENYPDFSYPIQTYSIFSGIGIIAFPAFVCTSFL